MRGAEAKIILDATADFPPGLEGNSKIGKAKAALTLNDKEIPEGMTSKSFLNKLNHFRTLKVYPKTAARGPQPFLEVLPEDGEAVVITAARVFTRLPDDARLAAEGKPVFVVEGIASIVNGWMAAEALDKAEAGKTAEAIAKDMEEAAGRMRVILALDTLDYLREGGRAEGSRGIKSIAYALGAMVKLKPVVEVTNKGLRAEFGWVQNRSREKSLEKLKEVVMGLGKMKKGMLVHAGAEAEAGVLGTDRDLLQALGLESIGIIEANKFLITHIGPKALAFCGELAE